MPKRCSAGKVLNPNTNRCEGYREKGYQGWKNYETWAVKLWMDNDEGLYNMQREWAKECKDEYELADRIKEFVEESKPEVEGLYSDLLQSAIDDVDYDEIAKTIKQEEKEG